jgi:purine catabolism regulator
MDIQSTARSMHLHPNSIRYRLSRVEALLGRSMSDPETIALLYLALNDRLETAKIGHHQGGNNGHQ